MRAREREERGEREGERKILKSMRWKHETCPTRKLLTRLNMFGKGETL